MNVVDGILEVGHSEEMEVERGADEKARAQKAGEAEHRQNGYMAQMRSSRRRPNLRLREGLEKRTVRFGGLLHGRWDDQESPRG
jgi:hypothetical protein